MEFFTNLSKLARVNSKRISTGEFLGKLADLSEATGLEKLCINHEILPPQHRSSPPHSHSDKEEFIYVLEGNPSVWINGKIIQLSPNEFIGFPPQKGLYHMIFNQSNVEAKMLVISTQQGEDDISYYFDDSLYASEIS
jgi:uncharacterized cupin superfamily protein